MDINLLKEQMLRSEGYAQGFKDGYASCIKYIVEQEAISKEKEAKKDN